MDQIQLRLFEKSRLASTERDMSDTRSANDAVAAAAQLVKQYGEDAEVIATLRAAEVAAMGDAAALDHWDRVIALLGEGSSVGATH